MIRPCRTPSEEASAERAAVACGDWHPRTHQTASRPNHALDGKWEPWGLVSDPLHAAVSAAGGAGPP